MFGSFKELKRFAIIRKLLLFIFKIIVVILSFLFLAIVTFIIQLSVKPRTITYLNDYILKKINSIPNINVNFKPSDATLRFNMDLELEYNIKDIKITFFNNKMELDSLSVDIDFTKMLFGKLTIDNITLQESELEIDLNELKNAEKKEFDYRELISYYQKILKKISDSSISINEFILKDFEIAIDFNKGKKSIINIISSRFDIDLESDNFLINQDTLFSINKNKIRTRLKTNCQNKNSFRECFIKFENINLNNYSTYFSKNSKIYNYLNNISGYFSGSVNFIFDENLKFDAGNVTLTSPLGSFYLKNFFDERINFTTLVVKADFRDNFNIFNLNSVNANFGDADFFMTMFFKEEKEYRDLNLNFDIKNIKLTRLKQLWPNFLGQEEGVRPWVLKHVVSGKSPRAWAKMNFKYFNNDKKEKSGLQNIYSEVQLKEVLLNYDDYFPEVNEIDGLAVFTEKNMLINITNGDIIKTKLNNATVSTDFTAPKINLIVKANTKGPLSDLFIHIDKGSANLIKNGLDSFIEDYHTTSEIALNIPIVDDIDFYKTGIFIDSAILNKKNSLLVNSSKILLSFIKPIKSNSFHGKIDLTKSNVEFLPLNIYKKKNQKLSFNYDCEFDNGIVYIKEFKPISQYITLNTNGIIDIKNKTQEIIIKDIKYNDSKYNLLFNSHTIKNKIYNDINISGENINYNDILDKIKELKISNTEAEVDNESNIILNLQSFNFDNNKKLLSPSLFAKFEDNKLVLLDFTADMTKKKKVKLSLNKRKNMFNLKSNDFGLLFNTIQLTDKFLNGSGEINLNQEIKGKRAIIIGNLKIDKKFSIIPNTDVKEEVLSDVGEDKNFKDLKKGLKKDVITFDKMKGEFSYSNDILYFKEVVLKSKFISFQILASGFINIKTDRIQVQGLLVPLGTINGLFGINKLPLIGDLIFGQKDAGLFASKFTVEKENKDSKTEIKIDKFSMILPGFLRNIFDKNNFK